MKLFDIDDLEQFVMDTIDSAFQNSPNRDGAKALIVSRFEIYRLSVQSTIEAVE